MSTELKREDRYIVFKLSDVEEHFTPGEKQQLARLAEVQQVGRSEAGKPPLECVVVEADWPEYEPTWKAIEARMTGAQPAPSDEYVGWYCAHCQRGVDASEVTYHEQHQVCGRVITEDKPPKPAPNMPEGTSFIDTSQWAGVVSTEIVHSYPPPSGWLRAIDEALIVAHIGMSNVDDTYERAKSKLDSLIRLHADIATDPAVNGGWKLVPTAESRHPGIHKMLNALHAVDNTPGASEWESYAAFLAATPEAKP